MRSSSESEGEIVESREDFKAIDGPTTFTKDRRIDRRSYSVTSDVSNSARGDRFYSRRNDDRSPSPFRHSRGDKRKRSDKHYDSSRELFNRRRDETRTRLSYHDLDNPHVRSSGHDRDGPRDREYGLPSRDRDRSRSPWRPGKSGERRDMRDRRDTEDGAGRLSRESRSREASKPPTPRPAQYGDEEREPKRVKFDSAAKSAAAEHNGDDAFGSLNGVNGSIGIDAVTSEPVDEEAEIERRRRERQAKREALLNKTKPSALLTQALNVSTPADSTPATPPIDTPSRTSRQVTPNASNPSTPRLESVPNSPLHADDLFKQLQELGEADANEISAAMYDPNMDLDDDRVRHEAERNRNGDISASAYNEAKTEERRDVLIPQPVDEPGDPKKSGGDMFADDSDDDDMFAAADKPLKASNPSKAVAIPAQGRALAADLHDNWDTPDGFYKTIVGELIDDRYVVKAALGKGVFATVVRAQDTQANKLVAIKIVRNNEAMRKAGLKEIDILQTLVSADPNDIYHIVRLHRSFVHKNHLCMVFENLGSNLRDLVKNFGRKTGLELHVVRSYAVQMFKALALMRECKLIHADLKPDNILSDAAQGKKIKIADLGSATSASDNEVTPYLASRFYRAPEVILGIAPSYPIDMWAIGCTLFELYTDAILFTGKSNNEMLKAIQECRGKISKKVIRRGTDALKIAHFDINMDLFASLERSGIPPKDTVRWINFGSQPAPGKDIKTRLLRAAQKKGVLQGAKQREHLKELEDFRDLLDKCLKLDPEERFTPREALAHRFCSGRPVATTKTGGRF